MSTQRVEQDIILNLKTLPPEKIQEVLDFIKFLQSQANNPSYDAFITLQLHALKSDWESPGMEMYDEM